MNNTDRHNETPCSDSYSELNGKGASYRMAPMISPPSTVQKMRIRGALVPMPRTQQ